MQIILPIKQRIFQYINTLGISMRDFYAKTGISRGILESNTGITEVTVAKFIASYPEISPMWLLTDKGNMPGQEDLTSAIEHVVKETESPGCEKCVIKDQLIGSLQSQIELQAKFIIHPETKTNPEQILNLWCCMAVYKIVA